MVAGVLRSWYGKYVEDKDGNGNRKKKTTGPALDQETLGKVHTVLATAQARGADPAFALQRAGLLWYPQREAQRIHHVLASMAEMLDRMSIRQLALGIGSEPATVLDTKNLIVKWLDRCAEVALEVEE